MKIIHNVEPSVIKLLSIPLDEKKIYRLSNCVLCEETPDGLLMCNTISGELIITSEKEAALLAKLPGVVSNSLSCLAEHGYIVPIDYNEKRIIEQLRLIFRKRQKGYYRNYVILPTTHCNARCFYCYENEIAHINMTEETAMRLVDFIENHYDKKRVSISWFGGEPLLGIRIIRKICSDLENRNICFSSKMVSNGLLFNDNIIDEAVCSWNLSLVQITLDGTENVYNKTKAYIGISENAYERVLRNINSLLRHEIHVNIRLNLDKHNKDNLLDLINELDQRIEDKNLLTVYVRPLNEDVGYAPIIHEEGEFEALMQYAKSLEKILEKKHMKTKSKNALPHFIFNQCMADGDDQLLCSPDGILGKCEHYIDRFSIGSLTDGVKDLETMHWWKQKLDFEECEKCPLVASCIKLTNCPVNRSICSEKERKEKLESFKKAMRNLYLEYMQECE